MQIDITQSNDERLNLAIRFAWQIFFERLTSERVRINKESSMQLHYASILNNIGELLCILPEETFALELESAYGRKNIDLTCGFNNVRAAIEMKCFRKVSNRAQDLDMYDVWVDIQRLASYENFAVKKFICLTDHSRYPHGKHGGYSEVFSIAEGMVYKKGDLLKPKWIGKWHDQSRDNSIPVPKDITFNWTGKNDWFFTIVDVSDSEDKTNLDL